MKAYVSQDACAGCELCHDICPEVFQMNEDGVAHTTTDDVPEDWEEVCRAAAGECPEDAIRITD